ncbi:ATP-dependent metallopeptidase FtsH/Yme1/Tma family protein [Methylorubrum thiocyanatum]|uniref:hypothetical protein n=1 Tax=Methylorubrum thiocyanatum TaxID=47958 RepID=UPI00398C6397
MGDRYHTAIHEAGHAVIGRKVTMVCGGATIKADDDLDAAGHAIVADADTTWRAWEMREKFRDLTSVMRGRIITIQAGHEAEAEILGEPLTGDDDDRECAEAMVEDAGFPEDQDAVVLARLRRFARQLARRHRADIERVAAALMERETLTGEEIDAMLPPGFMARPETWALAVG